MRKMAPALIILKQFEKILEQQTADYVDVEASRDERKGKGTLSKIFKQ